MSFPHPAPFIRVEHDARTDFVYSTDGKKSLLSYKVRRGGASGKILGTMHFTVDADGDPTSQYFERVES